MIKKRKIISGHQLEIEYYRCYPSGRKIRQPRTKLSSAAQQELNWRNAQKNIVRLVNANFTRNDIAFTGTYTKEAEPDTYDQVKVDVNRFIRQLRQLYKKNGRELKYIYTIERQTRKRSHDRWHVHVILNRLGIPGERELIESLWPHGLHNNTKRLQPDETGLAKIAAYICKEQAGGKGHRRYNASRNLAKPQVEVVNSPLSEAGLARIAMGAKLHDREYWERQYKNYIFVSADAWYSEALSCWQISIRMRHRSGGDDPDDYLEQLGLKE